MSARDWIRLNVQRDCKRPKSRVSKTCLFVQHYGFYADAINYITVTKGSYAILDPHNYMRYNNPSQQPTSGSIIGDTTDPNAATTTQFGEFWQELAGRFANNANVIFDLMNEVCDPFLSKQWIPRS